MGTHSQVGCHRISHSNEFFAKHGYLEAPGLVQWMATLRCGLSCEHCLAVSHESGFTDLPIEKAKKLIDEVAAMGVREFLLTGGEPLAREDLAEVIEYLGGREVNWSLNTAAMPGESLREAISRNKPGFVAVSLDGPKDVHDGFRGKVGAYEEALEAIRFYKSLGVKVCAGTTVTSRNYDYLDETFHLVAAGGADQWGIHLLVPEGRAAQRKDLFLSKAQLKRLIKFVARKRRYFDVEMADEIGYLGYLEPLVRDFPLSCGAGRAQCVILPDGAVVPCTTLDRSCSAGNIHERTLAQIWAEGFRDLRSWRPEGKCGHCAYSPACRGGCWLQRKSGTECFKDVWHVPGALKTAAGVAICLGSLAGYEGSRAMGQVVGGVPVAQAVGALAVAATTSPYLMDDTILTFYVDQAAGRPTNLPTGVDLNDPGWKSLKDFTTGTLPEDITERCTILRSALNTQERSLSLIALLWRAVSGPLFVVDSTKEYSQAERQTIRDTLAALQLKADEWRLEIFLKRLDPYLSNGRRMPSTMRTKSASAPVYIARDPVWDDLCVERWGAPANPETWDAATAYLVTHHHADQMDLVLRSYSGQQLTKYTGGKATAVSYYPNAPTIGVFEVIATTGDVKVYFDVKGSLKVVPTYETAQGSMLPDQAGEQDLSATVQVTLPGGKEYTYVELLNEIYKQQKDPVLSMAYGWLSRNTVPLWNQDVPVVAAVWQNGALLWPALREILESVPPTPPIVRPERALSISAVDTITPDVQQRAVLKDIDFWMF
jgi:radical SAM protein with 4Fe4S-binding SPASM domain